ncbi:hypothetical protein [Amycolatopsis marina]|uniref:hypothetical protein n=1 Tax=Amycolatopsis marina TaxID=490629 RepID=UPI001160A218|nr:hypothetical protein [Amycolatopsis marina]
MLIVVLLQWSWCGCRGGPAVRGRIPGGGGHQAVEVGQAGAEHPPELRALGLLGPPSGPDVLRAAARLGVAEALQPGSQAVGHVAALPVGMAGLDVAVRAVRLQRGHIGGGGAGGHADLLVVS